MDFCGNNRVICGILVLYGGIPVLICGIKLKFRGIQSSPDYCVKSKAIVFSSTFYDLYPYPFIFLGETSMAFYLHIREGLSKAFHFDSPSRIC
ncbi:hypothetical protein PH210_22690, partial [Paenibacillus sp. BSR1-1]|uniref:hypothetical protein n=1 Tax=Paenibacillus sp. BSR1-1 TaxID=3020845 RepID=UPI0025AF686E